MSVKQKKRIARHRKIRAAIHGTAERPRFCVFRSNQHIYARLVDDDNIKILMSASDKELAAKKRKKSDTAKEVGKLIAQKAMKNKIEKVVFDRAGFIFHGRVKALADGAREGGLKF